MIAMDCQPSHHPDHHLEIPGVIDALQDLWVGIDITEDMDVVDMTKPQPLPEIKQQTPQPKKNEEDSGRSYGVDALNMVLKGYAY